MTMFDDLTPHIQTAARDAWPQEMCGLIVAGEFRVCRNAAADPEHGFEIAPADLAAAGGDLAAIVHSHCNGRAAPSAADIRRQVATGVPWGIVVTDGVATTAPYWFGDGVEVPPLVGRRFRHGPSGSDGRGDCYAIVRDWYRLERRIALPEFPRNDGWWNAGERLYEDGFEAAGFRCYHRGPDYNGPLEPGDVILISLRGKTPHHAAVILDQKRMLHHLADTARNTHLSRREPLARWSRFATHWLRFDPASLRADGWPRRLEGAA